MELDFDAETPLQDFVTVPPGVYLCRVAEVREGNTRAGDERWSLRLVVCEGEHNGRQAAWDNLVFSARGLGRVRRVLAALGLRTQGKVRVSPRDLEGRQAFVEVRPGEWKDQTGTTVRRNEVPYDGYRPVNGWPDEPRNALRREADAAAEEPEEDHGLGL